MASNEYGNPYQKIEFSKIDPTDVTDKSNELYAQAFTDLGQGITNYALLKDKAKKEKEIKDKEEATNRAYFDHLVSNGAIADPKKSPFDNTKSYKTELALYNQGVIEKENARQEAIKNASLTRGSYGALVGDITRTNLLNAQDQLAVKAGYKKADHGGMNYSEYIASPYKATEKDALKLEMDNRAKELQPVESKMWGTNLQNGVQGEFKELYPTTSDNKGINDIRKYINRYGKDGDIGKKLNDVKYGEMFDYDSTRNYNVNKLMAAGASASEAADQVKAYMGPKPVTNTSESYKRIKYGADNSYNTQKTLAIAKYKQAVKDSAKTDAINKRNIVDVITEAVPDINKYSWTTDGQDSPSSHADTGLMGLLNMKIKDVKDHEGNKLNNFTVKMALKRGLINNAKLKNYIVNGGLDSASIGDKDIDTKAIKNIVKEIKRVAALPKNEQEKIAMSGSERAYKEYEDSLIKFANMRTATLNNSTNTPKPISDSERVDKLFKDIKPYSEQTPKTVLGESSNSGKDSKQIGSNGNGSDDGDVKKDFGSQNKNHDIHDPIEQNIVESKIQSIADITNTKNRANALREALDNIKDPAGKRDFAKNVANLLAYKRDKLNLKRILEQKPTTEEGNIRKSIDYLEAQLSANRHNSNLSTEVKKSSSKKIEDSINALKLRLSTYSNTKDNP